MATRAVNKKAKEGEQNARLLLSRGALSAIAIFRRAAFPSVRRWRCTAPYLLLAPAAPALCLSCFWRGRSPSPAFGAVFFCGEGGSYLVRGESRRSSMARSSRMRSRATGSGNIPPRCVPGRSTMAKCSRNAFPSVRRWQDCALMRSWPDWQWQYTRAVRPQVSIRGKISPRCVPGRLPMEKCSRNAFPGGNPWQVLRSMHPESGLGRENRQFVARFARHASENGLALAGYARHASEMSRKSPLEDTPREDPARKGHFSLHGPLESRMARESCHPASTKRPSARDPGTAEQCEPPELDRPAQETQPGRQRPRRFLGSKYRQQLPRRRHRSLPTPASSLSSRRTTLSSPTAPPVETASTSPPPR